MEKCGRQKVSVKLFLCSETQAKIFGRHALASRIFAIDVIRNQTSAEIISDHFYRSTLTPREYLNLHLISSRMFRLHLVINRGKISEHLGTPHRLKYIIILMAEERMGLLAPAIHVRVLWETAETWQQSFTLFVAVKHCGRFIIKGNRFYTSKATER